jgi:hypothetical protein
MTSCRACGAELRGVGNSCSVCGRPTGPGRKKPTTDVSESTSGYQTLICPPAGCEVATDTAAMVAVVMYQTGTLSDTRGAFTSAQKAEIYRECVDSGKIITVTNHTHGERNIKRQLIQTLRRGTRS